MTSLLAALPILLVLALMLGLRWSASRAGLSGLSTALLLGWLAFAPQLSAAGQSSAWRAVAGSLAEAGFISATILWIIFPALCIHALQSANGSLERLREALARVSHDPRLTALLVAWFFALFLEGAAGFGTSAALAAPFLVAMGFGKVQAVSIALIGHSIGVVFGAVGTPVIAQAALTGHEPQALASASVVYQLLAGWLVAIMLAVCLLRAQPMGPLANLVIWRWTGVAAVSFLLPSAALAWWVGPELPTLAGAVIGGSLFVLALLWRRQAGHAAGSGQSLGVLLKAAAPYLILIALILATRLISPLQSSLSGWQWQWQWGGFRGAVAPLYHPGSLLLLSFLLAAGLQRSRWNEVVAAMAVAGRRLLPVVVALLAMLSLSRLMVHAGMIEQLAQAAAYWAGGAWPLMVPFVGALGTFVTGSATASNILLSPFQEATAARLDQPPVPLLGAQSYGAALGNMVCPHNIIAAGAVVQMNGREGEVLRQTLPVCLFSASLAGLVAWLWLW